MVIELLIGSGLLVTAIILLLIFLYNPKNNQNTFDNIDSNNNNKSLADKVKEYKDNDIKRNQQIKPSHYENNGGKNVYYNTVDEEFNIHEEKQSKIIQKFEEENKISFSDIKTVRQYKSLESITKEVMNDNKKDNRNKGKRTGEPIKRRRIVKVKVKKPSIKTLAGIITKNLLLKNKKTPPGGKQVKLRKSEEELKNKKTPPRDKQVKLRESVEESPDNVADFFKNYETSDRITKKGNKLIEEVDGLFKTV